MGNGSMGDVAALGIAAAGAGLTVGLWKAAPWFAQGAYSAAVFGWERWQWLSVGSFAVNMAAVSVPGRIDGVEMAQDAKLKKSDQGALGDGFLVGRAEGVPGVPRDSRYRSLITPAGWAFSIWGVIYSGEAIFTASQAFNLWSPDADLLRRIAPWWALACGLQALWCAAFRPWAKAPRHFWLSPALLTAEAFALGGAHRVLRSALEGMSWQSYWTTHVPLSLHFGWITAAAVVNLNSLAALTLSHAAQIYVAFSSVFASAIIGSVVTLHTGDPIYAGVLAWALTAVAEDGGRRANDAISEGQLQRLSTAATSCARVLMLVAAVASLKCMADFVAVSDQK